MVTRYQSKRDLILLRTPWIRYQTWGLDLDDPLNELDRAYVDTGRSIGHSTKNARLDGGHLLPWRGILGVCDDMAEDEGVDARSCLNNALDDSGVFVGTLEESFERV